MSLGGAQTEALARAEEQIHQRIVSLSNLRSKRNSFLPVSTLPPETLAMIFIYGARDYHETRGVYISAPHVPAWVNVSYVCHHWRNVALGCSALWTYPFFASLRWTEELLLRSKQSPLTISFISSPADERKLQRLILLEKLLEHSERIQELRLNLFQLPAKFSLCAPNLEWLEIKSHPTSQSVVITDGNKPTLRTLRLSDCSLLWHSLNLNRLQTLSLSCLPCQLSMAEFLAVLREMHCLTALYLEEALPSSRSFLSSGGIGNSTKIDLPHLARLAIAVPLSAVVAFLTCVNIPLKTQLSLVPWAERGDSMDDYHPILSFIAQRSNTWSLSGTAFRSLNLDGDTPSLISSTSKRNHSPLSPSADIEDWGDDVPLEVILGSGLLELEMDGSIEEIEEIEETGLTESDMHRMICDICCSLPLANVQSLHITKPHQFSPDFWRTLLGCLGSLRHMRLSNGNMPDLSLLALRCESNENSGDKQSTLGHMFVPALKKLKLCHITFVRDDALWSSGISQKSLLDALSTRKKLRKRLIMVDCKVK